MKVKFKHWWDWFFYRKQKKVLEALIKEMDVHANNAMEMAIMDQMLYGQCQIKVYEENVDIKVEHIPFNTSKDSK